MPTGQIARECGCGESIVYAYAARAGIDVSQFQAEQVVEDAPLRCHPDGRILREAFAQVLASGIIAVSSYYVYNRHIFAQPAIQYETPDNHPESRS